MVVRRSSSAQSSLTVCCREAYRRCEGPFAQVNCYADPSQAFYCARYMCFLSLDGWRHARKIERKYCSTRERHCPGAQRTAFLMTNEQ
jgi:hypothetical protein